MNIKNELRRLEAPEPSEEHIQKTIDLCRAAYSVRRCMRPLSTPQMILSQFRFIAKSIWALQALVLLVMCFAVHQAALAQDALNIAHTMSLASVFTAMTMLPLYGRAGKYRMQEIEGATRLSRARLILAKLCVVGLGDAVCLIAFTFFSFGSMAKPLSATLVFIVMPFLLTSFADLFVLNRIKKSYGISVSVVVGIGISSAYWLMIQYLRPFALPAAAAACVLLLLALIFECRRLLRQVPAIELQDALMY